MTVEKTYKVIISGGGTGGHVYPAIAIADAFKAAYPGSHVHFVGAEGRMEMEKVPQHGYTIDGLRISGFQRKNLMKNVELPIKILSSLLKVNKILRRENPDIAIGVGGYASGPLLYEAGRQNIPILIQEQNSYPGLTNKILARRAQKICVAYPEMEKYFAKEKLVFTGNPVRNFYSSTIGKGEAAAHFGLQAGKRTVLITGGSLGARTINESIGAHLEEIKNSPVQLIWQTGESYYESIKETVKLPDNVLILPFIDAMDKAYALADIVVSRAGAISISELALLKKPAILVPSPNVAEDHQTKNAKALTTKNAAILVSDAEAREKLVGEMLALAENVERQNELSVNIGLFAKPDAAQDIVKEAVALIESRS